MWVITLDQEHSDREGRGFSPTDAAEMIRDSLGVCGPYRDIEGPLNNRYVLRPGVSVGHDQEAVLAIGAFDGMHLGHRKLIRAAIEDARSRGVPCLVVTFDPDPDELVAQGEPPRRILACEDRVRMALRLGVDGVIVLRFDAGLASMAPTPFVKLVLCWLVKPVSIHVGKNFRFGYHGMGNRASLTLYGIVEGFDVVTHDLVEYHGEPVSSTRIRRLLAESAGIEEANELLARCHFLRGVVEHGRGEGTSFGFPTANVRFSAGSCMPAQGVYGGYVTIGDEAWPAAINVGAPPTFSSPDELFCEANLIGFSGDVYGAEVCVTFVKWLRASRPFKSTEELEQVVLGNIDWVRTNLGDGRVEVALDH